MLPRRHKSCSRHEERPALGQSGHVVRVRITAPLHGSIDGIQLDRFQQGLIYDVGPVLGALLLAEQWAEPIPDDSPALVTPLTNVATFSDPPPESKVDPLRSEAEALKMDRAVAADSPR